MYRDELGTWHTAKPFRVKTLKKLHQGCNKKQLNEREATPAGGSLEGHASLDPEFPASVSPGAALFPGIYPRAGLSLASGLQYSASEVHTSLLVLAPGASPLHLPIRTSLRAGFLQPSVSNHEPP